MSKINSEEKSPLLFVLDSNDDLSRNRYFERSRLHGISTGATTVFTHFPNYLGTCWITTAICGLIFFMMIMLVLSTMTAVSLRVPRCVAAHDNPVNKTIHLVHFHDPARLETDQVNIVKDLMALYPEYIIRILAIHNDTETNNGVKNDKKGDELVNVTKNEILSTSTKKAVTEKKKPKKRRDIDFREANRLLDLFLRGPGGFFIGQTNPILANSSKKTTTKAPTTPKEKPVDTVEELSKIYPKNITYINTTFNQQFFASPMYPYYKFMNEKIQIFALRVLQIWQYGGASYEMQSSGGYLKDIKFNKFGKVNNFVITEKNIADNRQNSNQIGTPVVNVDDEALHLESEVPCHAFFGQILMLLRRTNKLTTVKDVMQISIRRFCKHYAPDMEYCLTYTSI